MLLADQDRALWDASSSRRARPSSGDCLRRNQPGPYQLQAAINAVHSDAPTARTDWRQILQLYDQLLAIAPSPIVALNRAVAVAEVDGPTRRSALVDGLDLEPATTCFTRSARTCCAVWVATRKPRQRMTPRSTALATPANATFFAAVARPCRSDRMPFV